MGFSDFVREKMRSFLRIQPPLAYQINIDGVLDYQANAIKNRIWYRGDANEISQLYSQIAQKQEKFMFWAAPSTPGMEIAKRHSGLPAIIVDTLSSIVTGNVNDIIFGDPEHQRIWEETAKENKFEKLLGKAVTTGLYIGDGAWKISFDREISNYPILEFYSGEQIDLLYRRGRVTEVIFKTIVHSTDSHNYTLEEHYGYGYIHYRLLRGESEIELTAIPETSDLVDITFGNPDERYMLAVPLQFYASEKYIGRGRSIFDKKTGAFDALDEALSLWLDALRAGRTKTYIPESLIPRDPNTGEVRLPNAFDNRYIQTDADLKEGANNRITSESAVIQSDGFLATYITALDLCLQGLISPSTIGIDVKKLDNAEAQREKEKVTLYTRGVMVESLQEDLEQLAENAIKGFYEWSQSQIVTVDAEVTFGDYANPSFESQIETVTHARQGGIMSIETAVDELYGDSREDEWKKEEVKRLKHENGIEEMEEPSARVDRL